jgi:predicted N-formylglutamate amidohydrolase
MGAAQAARGEAVPVRVGNRLGKGAFVVLCDHASSYLPPEFGTLGLTEAERSSHIAWDPGALPVARRLAAMLDAPLVESGLSRLVIDCNRPLDAVDLVPEISERTTIPGNRGVTQAERGRRAALSHEPYHAAIEALLDERHAAGRATGLVAIHSFTPVYKGFARPWRIGVIHDDDLRLAKPMLDALSATEMAVGDNEPYSPADRVYYTLERHARPRDLPCVMIEIRNDEIAAAADQRKWADLLAGILASMKPEASEVPLPTRKPSEQHGYHE